MFEKKKFRAGARGKINFVPKVAKADELRINASKSQKHTARLVEEWIKKSSAYEGNPKKQKEIDDFFQKKIALAEKEADRDYKKYYNYTKENFSQKEMIASGSRGNFMSKSFITKLNKLQSDKPQEIQNRTSSKKPKMSAAKKRTSSKPKTAAAKKPVRKTTAAKKTTVKKSAKKK